MNEREQAERFSRDVDNLLVATGRAETEAAPAEHGELLALAHTLAETDLSTESAVRQSLRRRLLTGEGARGGGSDSQGVRPMKPNTLRRMLAIGMAMTALLIPTFMLSPTVRAKMGEVAQTIGGLIFNLTDEYPGGDGPDSIWPEQTMSLPEAQAQLPFTIGLPAWVPEGFVREEEVRVLLPSGALTVTHVQISWKKLAGDGSSSGFWLLVEYPRPEEQGEIVVGPDSVKEVLVNGEPAGLVRGAWDANTKAWGFTDMMTLNWRLGDVAYHLFTSGRNTVTEEELIRMAESLAP